jgi:hypothetical protein
MARAGIAQTALKPRATTLSEFKRMNLHSLRYEEMTRTERLTQKMHEIYNKSTEIEIIRLPIKLVVFQRDTQRSDKPPVSGHIPTKPAEKEKLEIVQNWQKIAIAGSSFAG